VSITLTERGFTKETNLPMTSECRISTGPSIISRFCSAVGGCSLASSVFSSGGAFSSSGCSLRCSSFCGCLFLCLPPDFCRNWISQQEGHHRDYMARLSSRSYTTQRRHDGLSAADKIVFHGAVVGVMALSQPPEQFTGACRLIAGLLPLYECVLFL